MILPDVNVLVYAAREDVPDCARYRCWLEAALLGPEPVAMVAPVIAGFLRVVTNPRVFTHPSTLDDALAFVDAALAAPAAVAPALSERLTVTLAKVCHRAGATADRVPDAYLAAIALDLDAELVTADRGFARFEGLRRRHPFGPR
ncbi:MAG: Ribonuclease VapC43 [Actinobacteria bacterium ADurb.BinA094]|nr:MAG: Ribonuclease VapC43 [Actinobacteria bacterium ADurb.BinA094]